MKKLFLSLILLATICTGRAQTNIPDGYSMLCDSNGEALPGFYFPYTNVTGFPTNWTSPTYVSSQTNIVMTNAMAVSLAVSNYFATTINISIGMGWSGGVYVGSATTLTMGGTNNTYAPGNGTTGAVAIGGQSNTMVFADPDAVMVGGLDNYMTQAAGSVAIGGAGNTVSGNYNGIIGGWDDECGGTANFVAAGYNSWVINGNYSTILGGYNNTIGATYGFRGTAYNYSNPHANYSVVWGVCAWATNDSVTVIADNQGTNAWFFSGTNNQMIIRELNGVAINTNNAGTNALEVAGQLDAYSITINGQNATNLFSTLTLSNNLSILFNSAIVNATNGMWYFMTGVSNYVGSTSNLLNAGLLTVSNYTYSASNSLAGITLNVSNALAAINAGASNTLATSISTTSNWVVTVTNIMAATLTTTSNALQSQISVNQIRANTLTIPANSISVIYSFYVPMPDANYSVILEPEDNTSAAIPHYVDTLQAGSFVAHIQYATNAYNCAFYFIVKENQP